METSTATVSRHLRPRTLVAGLAILLFAGPGLSLDSASYREDLDIDGAAQRGPIPVESAGAASDLTVSVSAAGVTLSWFPSCDTNDNDYAVYAGTIGVFDDYLPAVCTTGGATSVTLTTVTGSEFFVVVPLDVLGTRVGSYGLRPGSGERPPSTSPCRAQTVSCSGFQVICPCFDGGDLHGVGIDFMCQLFEDGICTDALPEFIELRGSRDGSGPLDGTGPNDFIAAAGFAPNRCLLRDNAFGIVNDSAPIPISDAEVLVCMELLIHSCMFTINSCP